MARKPAAQSVDREDILWAAAEVLRRKGYDATTMKDIAAQVNLTAASLYHHFKNKDFLILNVLEVGLDIGIAKLEEIAASDLSNTAKLGQMIHYHVLSIANNVAIGSAMIFEIRPLLNAGAGNRYGGDKFKEEFSERRDRFFARRDYFEGLFRNVLLGGICAGEFRQVDAPTVTRAILGAHNWVGVWYRDGGRLSGEEVADVMVDTWLAALRASD
ncbi:MAG: TetR/AcrR family transcriptional regulator [Chloroflexota bacterium]|nr:TetR/AcrR family transcriptional regulator [Chloroflexota bacterium]